jgi:transcriptional regulator with AAA-type ATPase domain/polyferredoxin
MMNKHNGTEAMDTLSGPFSDQPVAESPPLGVRSLAEYLLSSGNCEEGVLDQALERQRQLRQRGYDASLADLLVESGQMPPSKLASVIRQRDIDSLGRSPLFSLLNRREILRIFEQGSVHEYAAGTVIHRQGEESDRAFIILDGSVSLGYRNGDGWETGIAILRSGESFGEMSLLSASPCFANERCLETTRLFSLSRPSFQALYKQHDSVFQTAVKNWFTSLLNARLHDAIQHDQQYHELISPKETMPCLQMTGSSRKGRDQRRLLSELAHRGSSILLLGEKGTMKRRVAQELHEAGPGRKSPFIVFDAADPPSFLSDLLPESNIPFRDREAMQMAALFGIEASARSSGNPQWQGFLRLAGNGTLVVQQAGQLCGKVQRQLSLYMQNGQFQPVGASGRSKAKARLIFTEEGDLEVHRSLLRILTPATMVLTPLRERKKDLKEMVGLMIQAIGKKEGKELSFDQQAMNKILAYNWPGNFRELEEVIRRAISLCHGPQISAGDIFIGRVSITGKEAFNLLQLGPVRHLFKSTFYPVAAQGAIAVLFFIVVVLGLFGSPAADSNVSLLLIWANWEPLLIISCLFLARIWCSLCPIGFMAQFFQRLPVRRFTLSPRTQNGLLFISAAGLALVFWSQAALDMWQHPASTAGLLLAMLLSAFFFAFFFEGGVWCRVVCPLGQMVATFGRISMLEVRSNFNYCSHQCRTYDCYNGREGVPGCRMVKGPFALESNHLCTLCGNCIKTCPNQSVRLNLRPPGWELWNMQKTDLAALVFVPLLWGTQLFRLMHGSAVESWLHEYINSLSIVYGVLLIGAVLFSYHLAVAGISFLGGQEGDKRSSSLFVFAMLPLAYANEVAIRLVPLLNQAADFFKVLGKQLGRSFPEVVFRLDMQSLEILQVMLICAGLAFSLFVLGRHQGLEKQDRLTHFFLQLPLYVMAAISIALL